MIVNIAYLSSKRQYIKTAESLVQRDIDMLESIQGAQKWSKGWNLSPFEDRQRAGVVQPGEVSRETCV